MKKTYATVLKDYSPVESGDFMLHYEINGREYVIYSPSEGVCSCLELYSFTDIDPEKLSFLIDSRNDIDVTEFRFVNSCSKEDLLKYLFDIEDIYEGEGICHVSKSEGFLLYSINELNRVRNLYIHDDAGSRLKFKNKDCFAIKGSFECEEIIICFSPTDFKLLYVDDAHINAGVCLLPDASPVISHYICEAVHKRNISLFAGNNVDMAFRFLSYYIQFMRLDQSFLFDNDAYNNTITITLCNWTGDKIMNIVSAVNRTFKGYSLCLSNYGDQSFISYNKNQGISKVLMKEILKRLNLDITLIF